MTDHTRYKRALAKHLRCGRPEKHRLLEQFDTSLEAFLEEKPEPDFRELQDAFGPPEEMAGVLMQQISENEKNHYRIKKRLVRVLALMLVIAWVLFTVYVFFQKQRPLNVRYEINPVITTTPSEEEP